MPAHALPPPRDPASRQRGVVLVIALVLLAIITLLGIAVMQTTVTEERMAGNLRDRSLAFQAAEAALREGERYLSPENNLVLPDFDGTEGRYLLADTGQPVWLEADGTLQDAESFWDIDDNVRVYPAEADGQPVDGVAAQQRYVLENISACRPGVGDSWVLGPCDKQPLFYRVTARGVGGSPNAVVVLQTTFKRRE